MIIFIVYYIINTFGMKVSREGEMPVWLGMWLSTIVLAPLGVFFTVKSNNDSAVFNFDAYVNIWKRLLGIRPKRNITRKEVIIHDPDYTDMHQTLDTLITTSRQYLGTLPRSTFFGYMAALIIGGETATAICTWIYKTFVPIIVYASTILILFGLLCMYLAGEKALTPDKKKAKEEGEK